MSRLTNVSCVYTGGNIYVYQALLDGTYWIYGGLDSWMDAYTYEPFRYQQETDSTETPEETRVQLGDIPTWHDIIDSLRQPDAEIFGDVDECVEIIEECQTLDKPVDIE